MTARLVADWPALERVHAFTTLRHGAGSSQAPFDAFNLGNCTAVDGDDYATVERNRAQLVERFALPSVPRWLRQVHGTSVLRFDAISGQHHPHPCPPLEGEGNPSALRAVFSTHPCPPLEGEGAELAADASVTSTPGVVLAVLTADCLPVVFAADDGEEVAVAHAGWRGLAAGVLECTVAAMRTSPAHLVAWLGPAAGPQAYEVGEEVFDAFVARDADAQSAFFATHPGHWRIDLYKLARQRLAAVGVTDVHGGGLCTISDPQRFYSHRRDGRTGRMATLVWSAR